MIRVIFFGHDKISLPFLREIEKQCQLMAIVVPSNRSSEQVKSLKTYALNHKIDLIQPESPNSQDFLEKIKKIKPDLAIVYNYSHIFKKPIIDLFPMGMINFHGGLLPQYRGANVINWVLVNGEKKTGVTAHYIDDKIDSGPIIRREAIRILKKDTALTLKQKLAVKAYELLKKVLVDLKKKRVITTRNDLNQGSYYHSRRPEDGRIDFNNRPEEIFNLVRALVKPWPGAFAYYHDKKVIFDQVRPSKIKTKLAPGYIEKVGKNSLMISVKDGSVFLDQYRGCSQKDFKSGENFS